MDRKDILQGILDNNPEALSEAKRLSDRLERQAALKQAAKSSTVKGRFNRKTIYKQLEKSNKKFTDVSMKLRESKRQRDALNAQIEMLEGAVQDSKKEISMCHDVLRNMDFSNSSEVIINDYDDVVYVVDGRKMHFDSNDHNVMSYSRWKKENKKPNDPEVGPESNDDFDLDDVGDLDFDGFDLRKP
jgi:hypothetical protein